MRHTCRVVDAARRAAATESLFGLGDAPAIPFYMAEFLETFSPIDGTSSREGD